MNLEFILQKLYVYSCSTSTIFLGVSQNNKSSRFAKYMKGLLIDLSLIAMPAKDDGRRLSNEMAAVGAKDFVLKVQ